MIENNVVNNFRMDQIKAYYSNISSYRPLMIDKARNMFYEKAIKYSCRDKVVLDIGAGLGLLSLMAIRAGASKVYAVEANPLAIEVLKRLKEDEKLDNLEIIHAPSWELELPEQVDVIVHEMFGPFLLDEMCIHTLEDVKKWLKPGGKLVPDSFGFDFKFYDSDNIESINYLATLSPTYDQLMQSGQTIIEDVLEDDLENWIGFGPWKFDNFPEGILEQRHTFKVATRIDSVWCKPYIMADGIRLNLYKNKNERHWGNSLLRFGQYTVMEEKSTLDLGFQVDENMASFKINVNVPKNLPGSYAE